MERAIILGEVQVQKSIPDAITAFLESRDVEVSSLKRYNRAIERFQEFCDARKVRSVSEVTTELMDAYQSHRRPLLAALSWAKEFDVLLSLIHI